MGCVIKLNWAGRDKKKCAEERMCMIIQLAKILKILKLRNKRIGKLQNKNKSVIFVD